MMVLSFGWTISYGQIKVVDGKVGVGTNAPNAKLHVYNDAYTGIFVQSLNNSAQVRLRAPNKAIVFDGFAGVQQGVMQVDSATTQFIWKNDMNGRFFWLTNGFRMVFTSDGRLGVGTPTPSHSLHVAGSAFKNDGSTTWLTASDRRLKKDINKYTDGLDKVLQIEPVRFTYTGKGGTKDGQVAIGIIAQELQKIAPYMIGEVELSDEQQTIIGKYGVPSEKMINTKTYLSYDATALPYMLLNAIKEQHKLIQEKELKIANLETQLTQVQARLAKLEAAILNHQQALIK